MLLCFALGGVVAGFSNALFIISSRHLLAAELTFFMLLEFSLGPIWVWIFINEIPTQWTILGGVIVMSAVLYNTFSELRRKKGQNLMKLLGWINLILEQSLVILIVFQALTFSTR